MRDGLLVYTEGFVAGYVEAMLWANTYGEDFEDKPDARGATVDDDTHRDAEAECIAFVESMRDALTLAERMGEAAEQAGHDFALTRNGHGAGFWDRGLGAVGDELTRACRPYGESTWVLGADGVVTGF